MSSDLGIDRSGNDNSWTVNNMAFSDQVVDSPTNNFCTHNVLYEPLGTYTEGNLKWIGPGAWAWAPSTIALPLTGKWYFETMLVNDGRNANDTYGSMGVMRTSTVRVADSWSGIRADALLMTDGYLGYNFSTTDSFTGTENKSAGDILSCAIDRDNNTYNFRLNNSSIWSGTLASNATEGLNFVVISHSASYGGTMITNYGQDSSFAGTKTAQGNQDGNDIGDFYYTPPTGYLTLCTKNLPDATVTPSEHFSATVHAGNASNGHAITGVGFQPDFVWSKTRTGTYDWFMVDSVRGNTKYLRSNEPDDEDTYTDVLTSFDSDGYTLGAAGKMNESNHSHVAYNWKAGGSAVSASNLTGVGTATISANTDAGFSIVQWTSTQGGPVSYGHGLSQTPEFVITKSVTDDDYWGVGHESLGWDKAWNLNDRRTAVDSTSYWNDTAPTSTIVTLGGAVNNAKRFITYNFHSVEGYQGFGKYAGNQNEDGPFVYLGFRPAFLMIFSITTQDDGHLVLDAAREPANRVDLLLYVSNNDAEADNSGTTGTSSRGIDFVSNGFKIRGANSLVNYSSREYAYWAIAETPFKHANAR